MQNPNGFRVVFYISLPMFVLMPLSCIVAILERISRALLVSRTSWSLYNGDRTISLPSGNGTDIDIALHIDNGPSYAILGVSIAAFIVSVIAMCGIWELRRVEGGSSHQRVWTWIMLATNFALVALSVGVLGWASALQTSQKSRLLFLEDFPPGPRLTRETWSCGISHKFNDREGWAAPACAVAQAARWLLLAFALSAIGIMLLTWKLMRERGGTKWLTGGAGRYGGFNNVYEMGPQPYAPTPAPGPYHQPVYFQPAPQFYPTPQPYTMPQPYPPAQPVAAPLPTKGGADSEDRSVFR